MIYLLQRLWYWSLDAAPRCATDGCPRPRASSGPYAHFTVHCEQHTYEVMRSLHVPEK